jgi:hypothetical protein
MRNDISARLAALSPEEKLELNERESKEILDLNPAYGAVYLKRKFARGESGEH